MTRLFTSTVALILTISLALTNSCKSTDELQKQLSSISTDSLFIEQNAPWQTANKHQLGGNTSELDKFDKDENVKVCTLEVVKLDRQSILLVTTSAVKTSDDTIYLFNPADYGGILVAGRQTSGLIASGAKSLNGKKIKWTADNSFTLDSKSFIRLDKTNDKDWFKQVVGQYCYGRGQDSLSIVLGGP